MINQVVAGSTLAEGIVLGVASYVLFRRKSAKLARCQRTWGDVLEVKERQGSEAPTRHPVIRYKNATGQEVTFESEYGGSHWKVKPGDRLEILVSADNPSDAEVVGFMAQWGLPLVFAAVSAASVVGAPILYLVLKP
jgi:hypothetical protein